MIEEPTDASDDVVPTDASHGVVPSSEKDGRRKGSSKSSSSSNDTASKRKHHEDLHSTRRQPSTAPDPNMAAESIVEARRLR